MSDILAIIAANAAAVAVVGYLLRLWIERRLEHSLSKELEEFRASLTKEVTRHSIQTTWNHAKRMELFAKLYDTMVEADFELKALFLNIKIQDQSLTAERSRKFLNKYLELSACLHKNELYLEDALVEEIRSTYKPFFDLAMAAGSGNADIKEIASTLPEGMEALAAVGDGPRRHLVEVFRKYAGLVE